MSWVDDTMAECVAECWGAAERAKTRGEGALECILAVLIHYQLIGCPLGRVLRCERLRRDCETTARIHRTLGNFDLANEFENEARAHESGYFEVSDEYDRYEMVAMFRGVNGRKESHA